MKKSRLIRDLNPQYDLGKRVTLCTGFGNLIHGTLAWGATENVLHSLLGGTRGKKGNWVLEVDGGYQVQILDRDRILERDTAK